MSIHGHLIELYQLGASAAGAFCAGVLLYLADKARRLYRAEGGSDPTVLATAISNIRDEGFRLTKHLLFVVIGILSIIFERDGQALTNREVVVRWILILVSTLMMVQSVMVWRDRRTLEKLALRRDRRFGDMPHRRRITDR